MVICDGRLLDEIEDDSKERLTGGGEMVVLKKESRLSNICRISGVLTAEPSALGFRARGIEARATYFSAIIPIW